MVGLSGWAYYNKHVIAGSIAGAQTDYQKKVIVHYGSGADSGENVYCNNHCKTDFGDLRIILADSTHLDIHIESQVNSDYAIVWFEVDAIPADPDTKTIYVCYGKADATTTSNGTNTFLLFDDFSSDTTGNYTKAGTVTYDAVNDWVVLGLDTEVVEQSRSRMFQGNFSNYAARAKVNFVGTYHAPYSQGGISVCKSGTTSGYEGCIIDGTLIANKLRMTEDEATELASVAFTATRSVWYRMEFACMASVQKYKNWLATNSEPAAYDLSATDASKNAGGAGFFAYSKQIYCDELAVRKYVDPEPAHGAWSGETARIKGSSLPSTMMTLLNNKIFFS